MHPKVVSDKPGLCPECGMNLVPAAPKHQHQEPRHEMPKLAHHDGFNKHAGHSTNIFKTKFWVSLALSIPVVAYSDVVQKLLDYQAPTFPGAVYLPLVLASVIFFTAVPYLSPLPIGSSRQNYRG